jgi:hypothetical protein
MDNLLRVLRVLHLVVKELASKRLVADRRAFMELAPALLSLTARLLTSFSAALAALLEPAAGSGAAPGALDAARAGTVFVLKIVRRALAHGVPALHGAQDAAAQLAAVVALLQALLARVLGGQLAPAPAAAAARCCQLAGKAVREVLARQSAAMAPHVDAILAATAHCAARALPPGLRATLLQLLAGLLGSPFAGGRAGALHAAGCEALARGFDDARAAAALQGVRPAPRRRRPNGSNGWRARRC